MGAEAGRRTSARNHHLRIVSDAKKIT